MSACCDCGREADRTLNERGKFTVELRPYGPGGAPICFDCMKATPDREATAVGAYGALLDAAGVIGEGVATIGTEEGPTPGPPRGV